MRPERFRALLPSGLCLSAARTRTVAQIYERAFTGGVEKCAPFMSCAHSNARRASLRCRECYRRFATRMPRHMREALCRVLLVNAAPRTGTEDYDLRCVPPPFLPPPERFYVRAAMAPTQSDTAQRLFCSSRFSEHGHTRTSQPMFRCPRAQIQPGYRPATVTTCLFSSMSTTVIPAISPVLSRVNVTKSAYVCIQVPRSEMPMPGREAQFRLSRDARGRGSSVRPMKCCLVVCGIECQSGSRLVDKRRVAPVPRYGPARQPPRWSNDCATRSPAVCTGARFRARTARYAPGRPCAEFWWRYSHTPPVRASSRRRQEGTRV